MTEGILRTMLLSKLTTPVLVALVVLIAGASAGLFGRSALASGTPQAKQPAATGQQAQAKDKPAQPDRQFVQAGTIKKIDLREGTIVLQVQNQVASTTFLTSRYIAAQADPRALWGKIMFTPGGNYNLVTPQTTGGFWALGYAPNPFVGNTSANWTEVYAGNPRIATNSTVWFPSVNGTVQIALQEVRRQLGPAVEVVIDGKGAKLTDLPANIWVTVTGDRNGRVTRIQADGATMDNCIVDSLDPVKPTLAFSQQDQRYQYEVTPQVEV